MWIQPNTTVKILRQVPLDDTYENTLWFETEQSQAYQFGTYAKYVIQNPPSALTYQRVNRNTIRINRVADDLYDCNYMMFQNTAYGTKWFYAFIKEVNYINDNVTELVYSIDDIQTWFFDYEFEQCFIERQHEPNDVIGQNIVPENISVGEYELKSFTVPDVLKASNCKIVISSSLEEGEGGVFVDVGGGIYRGIYSGCDYVTFNNDFIGSQQLESYIKSLGFPDRTDSIVNVFLCPTFLITNKNATTYNKPVISFPRPTNAGGDGVQGVTGYRNNKLMTYPYTFLYVTNFQGLGKAYPYEFFSSYWNGTSFDDNNVYFELNGDYTAAPTVTLTPFEFKAEIGTMADAPHLNKDEIITSGHYPQCTYNVDAFKAWMAQSVGLAAITLGGLATMAGFGAVGVMGAKAMVSEFNQANADHPFGTEAIPMRPNIAYEAGTKAVSKMSEISESKPVHAIVASHLAKGYDAFLNPVHQRGNQSDGALFVNDAVGFGFGMKQVEDRFAKIIDDYFTMYGYAQHRIGKPNIRVRELFTYVKTVGCAIRGSLPMDSARHICQLFDNGIRFWTDRDLIGEYDHNNPTYRPPI